VRRLSRSWRAGKEGNGRESVEGKERPSVDQRVCRRILMQITRWEEIADIDVHPDWLPSLDLESLGEERDAFVSRSRSHLTFPSPSCLPPKPSPPSQRACHLSLPARVRTRSSHVSSTLKKFRLQTRKDAHKRTLRSPAPSTSTFLTHSSTRSLSLEGAGRMFKAAATRV